MNIVRAGLTLTAIVLSLSSAASADGLSGQASIIDGDTLEIHGTRIRLWGIDAPVAVRTACSTDAARRQRTNLTPS